MTPPERGAARLGPRRGLFERLLAGAFLVALLLFAYDYILGGSQATGLIWYRTRIHVIEFLAWQIQAYVWLLVALVAFLVVSLRGLLPVIEIPIMHGEHGQAEWIKKWYLPGTLHCQDDVWTWREGKHHAYIHRRYLARRGALAWGVTVPVERCVNDADLEVTYDTRDVETYLSRTLNRRLQREVQERVVQDHRALREQS